EVSETNLTGHLPPTLGRLSKLNELSLNGTAVTCPPDSTPCVVQQSSQSAFCSACPSFCSTCVKSAPATPHSPEASPSQSGSGLSVGAIAGIAVAAVMLLIIGPHPDIAHPSPQGLADQGRGHVKNILCYMGLIGAPIADERELSSSVCAISRSSAI
ncbi:unnamed protein product, partial [Closterium sp. Naga37s-1]